MTKINENNGGGTSRKEKLHIDYSDLCIKELMKDIDRFDCGWVSDNKIEVNNGYKIEQDSCDVCGSQVRYGYCEYCGREKEY